MKKHTLILIIVISILVIENAIFIYMGYNYMSNKNKNVWQYELSENTALQIGKIILMDKFPGAVLNDDKKFHVFYTANSWIIRYSLKKEERYNEKGEYVYGGVYSIELKKSNCEILNIEVWY